MSPRENDEKMLQKVLNYVSEQCGDSEMSFDNFSKLVVDDQNQEWKAVLINWVNHQPNMNWHGLYHQIFRFEKQGDHVIYTVCVGVRALNDNNQTEWYAEFIPGTTAFYITRDHYLISVAIHKS